MTSIFSARLFARSLLLGCFVLLSTGSGASGNPPFANVTRLKGEVTATSPQGETRQLRAGAPVFVGEKLRASANGEAVLQTGDAGIVAVRPNAEFIPINFVAEGKNTDHQVLRLISGSLRVISGWIGQINRSGQRVITPTATIGIRGTDHEPFVLPAAMASSSTPQGTYDKVNRGATLLDANGGSVAIEPGKVGFARDPGASKGRTRAMMTLLLPVLLTKVPDFYVPGAFDEELDRLSATADANARQQFERLSGQRLEIAPQKVATPTQARNEARTGTTESRPAQATATCAPQALGEAWLAQLDRAIARRDIRTLLGLFTADIVARATVPRGNEIVTLEFDRNEMVQSILDSVSSLKDYRQRRPSIEATLAAGESTESCKRLLVRSEVIEQGLMNEQPFRFEALEEYLLELRHGEWQAVQAHTTQR